MFNIAKGSTPTSPRYECSLAGEGCHEDKDCSYRFLKGCFCKGASCVRYRDETLDTDKTKTVAYINRYRNMRVLNRFGGMRDRSDLFWGRESGCELKTGGGRGNFKYERERDFMFFRGRDTGIERNSGIWDCTFFVTS